MHGTLLSIMDKLARKKKKTECPALTQFIFYEEIVNKQKKKQKKNPKMKGDNQTVS